MSEEELTEAQSAVDIHDIELLKKLWFMIRDSQSSKDVFTLTKLVLDSLPYDWIDPQENWLLIASQLELHGEDELASIFKLANRKVFHLTLNGK